MIRDKETRVRWRTTILGLIAIALATPVRAEDPIQPQQLLQQLNQAALAPGEIYVARNVRLTRDRVTIYLNRGFVAMFAPVAGEVTGAVFVGDGEVLMMPPDTMERASLARFTQAAILDERFTSAYFRFTDQTASELMAAVRRPEPEDTDQPGDLAGRWAPILQKLNLEYSMRILMDLTGERDRPGFLAYLNGVTLGTFQVEVDERVPEAVRVGAIRVVEGQAFADMWCTFPSMRSQKRFDELMTGSFRVESFRIDTRINADHSLGATAELSMEARSGRDRIVPLELSRFLKVKEVTDESGAALALFQNPGDETAQTVRRETDWIAVVLPHSYPVGRQFKLRLKYEGSVIRDAGNGVLHVGERTNWYPNRGVYSRTSYDLSFEYPDSLTLVATGALVEESGSGGWKRSRWKSTRPQPVAGFNLGGYRSSERRAGDVQIKVFATREVEANVAKAGTSLLPYRDTNFPEAETRVTMNSATPIPPNPTSMLDNVADLATEAVTRYQDFFGPLSIRTLMVTQVPGHFGQGWPGLVYLPSMVFLSRADRIRLGFDSRSESTLNELMLAHEIAHQWWGNEIGWETYHDQWLSEGFATYSAALQIAAGKDGDRKLQELLRTYRAELTARTPQGKTVESGGPIYLGNRLSNSQNPGGFNDIIYKKSCWVIHMLRELMASAPKKKEEPFFTMLREFINTYRGRGASTQGFIHVAEKYMTPAMNLERNRKLDWFFDDWVYGTGVPHYKLNSEVKKSRSGKFIIQGKIQQTGVSEGFEMPVPIVAKFSRDRTERLGWIVVGEQGGEFRFTVAEKPDRVAIDEDAILAILD